MIQARVVSDSDAATLPGSSFHSICLKVVMHSKLHILLIVCLASSPIQTSAAETQPNILLILTDDQGWATLGCYGGGDVPTPNLDQLAASGARFTNAYVTSQCTPTRATLLSGQYTARNKMWHVIRWYGLPWAPMTEAPFREQFPRDSVTMGSELKRAGYVTGIFGKWHLTSGDDGSYMHLNATAAEHYGFDEAGAPLAKSEFVEGGDRGVQTLTRQAGDFIEKHRDRPWFCYLSHHMIHGVVVAPKKITEKYRQLGYGDEGPNRAVYLAGLETIDRSVGQLMQRLEMLGEIENTIVVFLSDNGGIDQRLEHRALPKPHPLAPKLLPNLREYDNAPLRAGKGSIYEGGVRVPMIIRWPKNIPQGQVINTPVHAVDLMPTLLDAANVIPTPSHELDGKSLLRLLKERADQNLSDRPIFQYCPFYDLNWGLTPCASIRVGDFKLIEFFGDRFDKSNQYVSGYHVELYDLKEDVGEQHNLADRDPKRREKLLSELHQWMQEMGVTKSVENPNYQQVRAFETTNQKPATIQ